MDFNDFKRKVQIRQFAINCSGRGAVKTENTVEISEINSVSDAEDIFNVLRDRIENELSQAAESREVGIYLPIYSCRKILGIIIVFIKRVIRKLLKIFLGWYLFPIYNRQSHFNGKLLNAVALERELIYEHETKLQSVESLTRQVDELTSRLSQTQQSLEAAVSALNVKNEKNLHVLTVMNKETIRAFSERILIFEQQHDAFQNQLNKMQNKTAESILSLKTEQTRVTESIASLSAEQLKTADFLRHLDVDQNQIRREIKKLANLPTDEDDFYHAFEEKFRGSRDDIKNRLQVYVPLIKEQLPNWGKGRFVDIGSGRGEWLDILRDNGAEDRIGIDLNQRQNEICEGFGHKTVCMDAIEYITQQPDNSLDLVSGIQIIEHLPMSALMELLKQCHRALKHGGMILFETLNPRNLVVGADTFYIDPSHKRPLEPRTVEFFAEYCGFHLVKTINANSSVLWEGVPLIEGDPEYELKRQFNDIKWLLYGPQDYALFAVKE